MFRTRTTEFFLFFFIFQEFRVWNIGDYKCVQVRKFNTLHPKCPIALYIHPHTEVVVGATGNLGVLEPSSDYHEKYVCGRAYSHSRPLCGALYNDVFDQVSGGQRHLVKNDVLLYLGQGKVPKHIHCIFKFTTYKRGLPLNNNINRRIIEYTIILLTEHPLYSLIP